MSLLEVKRKNAGRLIVQSSQFMTWSLVKRFESSEHETYMIFLYDIKFFYGP